MSTLWYFLAILFSFIGMMFPPIQALFPRIALITYYRQRTFRRLLAGLGLLCMILVWITNPSITTWIVSGLLIIFLAASEFVLVPDKVIPPLDNPPVLPAAQVNLSESTQVLGIVLDGHAHAWPMNLLIPHHIINESIQNTPVTAAYCPACRSGYVYDPVVNGQRLTFEPVTIRRRNMVMRDRETGTIWQHETGKALMGKYFGNTLKILGGEISNWGSWKTDYPDTTISTHPVGYHHPSPLGPIFERLLDEGPTHLVGPGLTGQDHRLPQHAFVAGVVVGKISKAYPMDELKNQPLILDQINNHTILVLYDSSSDRVRCFSLDGFPQKLNFEVSNNQLTIPGTGSYWDFQGQSVQRNDRNLVPIRVQRLWWLAWSEFHPESLVYKND